MAGAAARIIRTFAAIATDAGIVIAQATGASYFTDGMAARGGEEETGIGAIAATGDLHPFGAVAQIKLAGVDDGNRGLDQLQLRQAGILNGYRD